MAPWVTEKFLAVLSGLQERFKESKGSQRQEVIDEGVQEITASAKKDGVALPANLPKKVLVWFQNTQQRKQQSTSKTSKATQDGRVATTWTVRKVVKEQMSAELNALILKKDSTALPGAKAYLKLVQECLTELVEGLSKDKAEEFANLAAQWNSVGVDSELQAKQADKHFVNVAKKFMDDVYKQMGVQVFMLVGYKNSEGDVVRSKVETDTITPTKKQFTPIFNKVGGNVWNRWDQYLQNQADDEQEENNGATSKVIADKSVPWPLNHDADGYPTLPPMDGKSLPDVKDIVRSFVTLSYRHVANNPKAIVPWSALLQTPDKFLEPCYLPAGVRLTEISKMKGETLNACVHHWLERVEKGEIAFRFKAVDKSQLRATQSKKKRSAPPTDDERQKSSEGDDCGMDGGDGHPEEAKSVVNAVQEVTGKGKAKALLPLCPADVPKEAEQQIEFLFSLSKEEEYVQLVRQAADVLEDSDATISCKPGPKWASWSYKSQNLSPRFHSSTNGFEEFIKWLKNMPYCAETMVAYSQSQVLVVCLGIGMVLHDLHVIQFDLGEGDHKSSTKSSTLDPAIAHVQKSKLEWAHTQVLLQMCVTIAADLNECLDPGEKEDAATAGSKRKKPSVKRQKRLPDRYGFDVQESQNKH